MKEDSSTSQTPSSGARESHHGDYQQTIPSNEHELDAPPAYTPSTATALSNPIRAASISSQERVSQSSQRNTTSLLPLPSSEHREPYKPTSNMSMSNEDPYSKYDDQPGCCFGETGGCCFSSRGGCCFSDTEGCCFSETAGCCFSKNEACCFSDHKACCFSGGR